MPPKAVLFELKGFKEIEGFLNEMSKKSGNKLMRKALKTPGQRLEVAIKNALGRLTTMRTGELMSSIGSKMKTSQRYGNVSFEISGAYYGRFVDLGHHVVKERAAGNVRIRKKGVRGADGRIRSRYGTQVKFVQPRPFIRQPFEFLKPSLNKEISDILQAEVFAAWNKHVAKLGKLAA